MAYKLFVNDTDAIQGYYDKWGEMHRLQPGEERWLDMIDPSDPIPGVGIQSVPPEGKLPVTNIYVDPDTNKTVVDYADPLPEKE